MLPWWLPIVLLDKAQFNFWGLICDQPCCSVVETSMRTMDFEYLCLMM